MENAPLSKDQSAKQPVEQLAKQPAKQPAKKKEKKPRDKKFVAGLVTLIVGVFALAAGVSVMLLTIFAEPETRDAEYLVQVGTWEREDGEGVIWEFTEIGKGKLTTNNHVNDYDFIWAIEGDKLKVETDWLYTLDNEYEYKLDKTESVLTLGDVNLRPASSVDPEVTEDN